MKKTTLLNPALSALVAQCGHFDEITVGDAGLPIPAHVERIDMALSPGVPSLVACIDALLTELQIQSVTLATEIIEINPQVHQQILQRIEQEQRHSGRQIEVVYISHDAFKQQSHHSRAIVRSGECTPYANVIFSCGVPF
ncbi:D-ribose pyranase [Shewanella sp. NIFS-20-20]|uniref:D-ribose pyranase n=1 Tax=Shewanella sp. NIFS-20-20 TaxID=2853806 RepID=UPI001C46BF1B|nr:D-ribose pyranase [Shewanella sp. NIFS-20-20]MBV7315400.1 D-ribose pyranase [Shewanella sp. NIFS-20-20]